MAAQLRPEPCAHRQVRWNPLTVEKAPWVERGISVGHFLRQSGKCECGRWVVRVTEVIAFGPVRELRGLVKGVDPR